MEPNEIQNLERLKNLYFLYFQSVNPRDNKTKTNVAEIKFANYFELGCVITDMLKLCVLSLDHDSSNISEINKSKSVNVSLILEIVLDMFPLHEFEFLSEMNRVFNEDFQVITE